jgi:hypothetical protein
MIKIPLTGKRGIGKFALIDNEDFDKIKQYKWHLETTGYPTRSYRVHYTRFNQKLHSLIMGKNPEGKIVDHANQNQLDNQKSNLRFVTHSENSLNQKRRKDNTSGYRGISWNKNAKKWKVYGTVGGIKYHIGYFKKKSDAILAVKELLA